MQNLPAEFFANLLVIAPEVSLVEAVLLYQSSVDVEVAAPDAAPVADHFVETVRRQPVGFAPRAHADIIRYGFHK